MSSPAETHGSESEAESAHSELLPDEPETPMWLPLVGAALFLLMIVLFVATRPAGKSEAELSKEAAGATSATPSASTSAAQAPRPAMPAPRPAAVPQPARPQPHMPIMHPIRRLRPLPKP
jgi:hypothetical protein